MHLDLILPTVIVVLQFNLFFSYGLESIYACFDFILLHCFEQICEYRSCISITVTTLGQSQNTKWKFESESNAFVKSSSQIAKVLCVFYYSK